MTRLEKRLIKTFLNVRGMIYDTSRTTDTEFIREYRHFLKLGRRYEKATGTRFNPFLYVEANTEEIKQERKDDLARICETSIYHEHNGQ